MKLGVVSDIHEDADNLRKALNILLAHKIDYIICLGDITGYSLEQNEIKHLIFSLIFCKVATFSFQLP